MCVIFVAVRNSVGDFVQFSIAMGLSPVSVMYSTCLTSCVTTACKYESPLLRVIALGRIPVHSFTLMSRPELDTRPEPLL
jgi:hypothetical protein